MPLELEDFPLIVSQGLQIFNDLRDLYIPGEYPVYNGKDLSSLDTLFSIYDITDIHEKQILLRIINIFDSSAVKAARKRMENLKKKISNKPGSIGRV